MDNAKALLVHKERNQSENLVGGYNKIEVEN